MSDAKPVQRSTKTSLGRGLGGAWASSTRIPGRTAPRNRVVRPGLITSQSRAQRHVKGIFRILHVGSRFIVFSS